MPSYRTPHGYVHLNLGRGRNARNAPKHCRAKLANGAPCCGMSTFECDWPGCDIPLCSECACEVGENYHLCPAHRAQPGLDIGERDDELQLSLV